MKIFFAIAFCLSAHSYAAPSKAPPTDVTKVVVYKSPTCGCCNKWIDHLKKAGFKVEGHSTYGVGAKKKVLGVPESLHSCHTAVVNGYVVEGHVPADSIKKMLKDKPKIKGLAVAGMPVGSPGMEGLSPEKYNVMSFGEDGEKVFDSY